MNIVEDQLAIYVDIQLFPSALRSVNAMYQECSRFNDILKRSSCEIDTAYFLARVSKKVYYATQHKVARIHNLL
jgi:hypothetical protein